MMLVMFVYGGNLSVMLMSVGNEFDVSSMMMWNLMGSDMS
jgi:hypothetical protein